jgi:hypothetical protein
MKNEKSIVLALMVFMTVVTATASVVSQITGRPQPVVVVPTPPETTEAFRGRELSGEPPKAVATNTPIQTETKAPPRGIPQAAQTEVLLRKLYTAKEQELAQAYADICTMIKDGAIEEKLIPDIHRTWQNRQREAGKYDFYATEAIVQYELARHHPIPAIRVLKEEIQVIRAKRLALGKYIDGTEVTDRDAVIADIQKRTQNCLEK